LLIIRSSTVDPLVVQEAYRITDAGAASHPPQGRDGTLVGAVLGAS